MIVALTQLLYYFSCHKLLSFLLRARVDVSAVDPERLEPPVIIASNHPSRIDPFLIVLLPFRIVRRIVPFYALTAAVYYDRWWIGPFARLMGAYRLAPSGRTVEDYLGGSLEHIKRGRSILLFPEGRLNRDQQRWPAKPGVAQLALRTGAPILPLRIHGVSKIRLADIARRRVDLKLTAGSLIEVPQQEPTRQKATQLARQVMETIRSL